MTTMTTMTSMKPLLLDRVTAIWFLLIAATLTSWFFGTDHGIDDHAATTLVLLVAFIKVRVVGLHFMELRTAPVALRAVFEAYCLIVCVLLLSLYYAS